MKYHVRFKISYPNNWYINCFTSMASESVNVTVTVKTLSGDLIELSVDPALGLDGVETALTLFDSEQFPQEITKVSFLNEDENTLTNETFLLAIVSPLESIYRVDTFEWKGNTSYRFRIQADRRKSMKWMYTLISNLDLDTLETLKNYPQLFDICYYPSEGTFRIPDGGESLQKLTKSVGKRYKRIETTLINPAKDAIFIGPRTIIYRRENVGLHEFDDEISKLSSLQRNERSEFKMTETAIKRICTLITNWISKNNI